MRAPGSNRGLTTGISGAVRAFVFVGVGALGATLAACKGHDSPPASRVFTNPPGVPRPTRSLEIDVADPDAPCAFTRGFSVAEPWRWSLGRDSRIDFDFRPDPKPMVLELLLRAADGPTPQVITLTLNDRSIGELRPSGQERAHRIELAADALRTGHNVLAMRYAWTRRASEADDRDIAVAYRRIAFLPVPDRADVTVAAGRAGLGEGWSHDERDSERTFAWSEGPRSTLRFVLSPSGGRYALLLRGLAIAPDVAIAVLVAGKEVARLMPQPGWSEARVAFAGDGLHDGPNDIELRYSKTVRPTAADPKSTDTRELGFALVHASLAPAED